MILFKELCMLYCLVINVHVLLFSVAHASALLDYHVFQSLSTTFFIFFKIFFCTDFERRKRDLNPRAAINDLLPFQGSPFSLLGISP